MFNLRTLTHAHIGFSATFNFSYILFSYARLTYKKCENYHHTKITHYTVIPIAIDPSTISVVSVLLSFSSYRLSTQDKFYIVALNASTDEVLEIDRLNFDLRLICEYYML